MEREEEKRYALVWNRMMEQNKTRLFIGYKQRKLDDRKGKKEKSVFPLNASVSVTKFKLELNGMLSVPPSFNPYVASVGQITQTLTKNDNTLTSLEFSLRYWTTAKRNSLWEILIPLMSSSCSESAKNIQFPSPWLPEITKPLSKEMLFKFSESSVLLVFVRASSWICWSAWKTFSSVNDRGKPIKKRSLFALV